jgi:hypothetical protein
VEKRNVLVLLKFNVTGAPTSKEKVSETAVRSNVFRVVWVNPITSKIQTGG